MTRRLIGPTAAAIVKPRTKPRNANAGSTGTPCGREGRKNASADAGASLALGVGARRGARRQVEVARMGPCCDRVRRWVEVMSGAGWGTGDPSVNVAATLRR